MPDRPAPRSRSAARAGRAPGSSARGEAAGARADGSATTPKPRVAATRVGPRENALHVPEYRAMLAALQQARLDAGLTLDQVAARLGRPISYIWKSERGERRVDAVELWRFAGVYGRAVSDFLPAQPFRPNGSR